MVSIRHIVLSIVLVFACVGCTPEQPKDTVILWTAFEGSELETLREQVELFEKNSGRRVTLLKVPFDGFRNKVMVAGPAGQGPDILIAPHDWIGMLETAGLLAPIPKEVIDPENNQFLPVALKAASYNGGIHSAPMMMGCVVLARNTELCPEKPQDLNSLVSIALQCQEADNGARGFAYELRNFYFSWAFLAGFGADFLAPFSAKTLDISELKFDTPEAVKGTEWIASLRQQYDLVQPGTTNEGAVDLFLNGKMGMILCGPWNLGAIRKAGIDYELEPIPPGPSGNSSPFVEVTGALLTKYSVGKPGVNELLTFLSSPETVAALCQSSGRAPTRTDATELLKKQVSDPIVARDLELFAQAAELGTPIPNHPAMAAVWEPAKQALELITTGQVPAESELERTTERVREKIRFMTE